MFCFPGISAGAWYDYAGSAVDFLCLPHDPDVIQSDLRKSVHYKDFLYGAEYQGDYFGTNTDANDVPCAVCRAKHASSTLMIPGKTTCSGSLKLEYIVQWKAWQWTLFEPREFSIRVHGHESRSSGIWICK